MKLILETERFVLREINEQDLPAILSMNRDPDVLKYLHEIPLRDLEHARDIVEKIIYPQYKRGLGRWAVIEKSSGQFTGWCGLKHRPELNETDLGYRFLKANWGRGIATETASEVLNYGFRELQLKDITGRAHVENLASQKILEKIGMQFIREETVDDTPVKTYLAINPYQDDQLQSQRLA